MRAAGPSALLSAALALLPAPARALEPRKAENFRLLDQQGRAHELYRYSGSRLVLLFAHAAEEPAFPAALSALTRRARAWGPRGVSVLGLDVDTRGGRRELIRLSRHAGLALPVLSDPAQTIARGLGLSRAGEVLVVEMAGRTIAYQGTILGEGSERLAKVVEGLLSGAPLPPGGPPLVGRPLRYESLRRVDYASDVVPILKARCLQCHGDQGVPPRLESHKDVSGWGAMIRETVRTQSMPPWGADPLVGSFLNDRALTPEESRALVSWLEAGAPRGSGEDALSVSSAAPAPPWPEKRRLVLSMPGPQRIPASGPQPYRYVGLEPDPTPRDLCLSSVRFKVGNPSVVHHATLLSLPRPAREYDHDAVWRGQEDLALLVVGGASVRFSRRAFDMPPGTCLWIPRGHHASLEMHYAPSGREEEDRTVVEVLLHERPEEARRLRHLLVSNGRFRIPPGAPSHDVWAKRRLDKEIEVFWLNPHMHMRGDRARIIAIYPDDSREVLLSVTRYDFGSQPTFVLRTPKVLPAGTELVMNCGYDNSAANPANPDPSRWVEPGPQDTDEMCIGKVFYADR